jgi:aldehyde:ferredoxin oxidoreductase
MNPFPDAQILDINLTSREIVKRSIPGSIYRLYPGGSALGVYLILQEMAVGIDPLSPENLLVFSVSPFTGLNMSGLSRIVVSTKSPLTNTIGDSQAGGNFPIYLKGNGYDSVVFRGRSEKPVYVYLDGDKVEIRDAAKMWGRITGESEKLIREDLGEDKVEIAQIGPAGENMVKFANIINMCNRANGRNGTGAVMGSKNLKALVLKRFKNLKPFNSEAFKGITKNVKAQLEDNQCVSGLGKFGTDGDLEGFNKEGFLPTKNWNSGYFPEGAKEITGTTMFETVLKDRDTCYACSVRCKRVVEIPGVVDPLYGGPEYETCGTFGSYCCIGDLATICQANQLCNMYGLDTISCGATIAFAMECFEEGLINEKDTGGLKLNFGNKEVIVPLIELIARRGGIGDLLAEGSKRASEKIGNGAESFSISVKGQELPAHMPQYKPAVGLVYAVNPFGADHQSSEHDTFMIMPADSRERKRLAQIGSTAEYDNTFVIDDDKVRFAFDSQCYFSILDTLCLCQFVWGPCWELYGPDDLIDLCKYGLGWETSLFELMRVGERRLNMMRYFNAREGFTKKEDVLPDRIFKPLIDGPSKGVHLDKEKFLEARELYYSFAGWDEKTGNPTENTLRKLSLGWLLEKI